MIEGLGLLSVRDIFNLLREPSWLAIFRSEFGRAGVISRSKASGAANLSRQCRSALLHELLTKMASQHAPFHKQGFGAVMKAVCVVL